MNGPDQETFETITRKDDERRRAELVADYGNEAAGRDTGRMKRHFPGETGAAKDARKREEATRRMLNALDQLLLDPVYRARYEAFGSFLTDAETRTDTLLDRAELALAEASTKLDEVLQGANRSLDGRRVFRFADGRVIDENGETLDADEAAGIVWKSDAPTAEEFIEAKRRRDDAELHLHELQGFRTDLGEVRDRYEDADNPLAIEEMDDIERDMSELFKSLSVDAAPAISESLPSTDQKPPPETLTLGN